MTCEHLPYQINAYTEGILMQTLERMSGTTTAVVTTPAPALPPAGQDAGPKGWLNFMQQKL